MNVQDSVGTDSAATERRLAAWLEKNIGGKVIGMRRQERWRPAWFVDIDHPDGPKKIYVRGERTSKSVSYSLDYEYRIFQVLETHKIPVPHVYGICPDPHAIIMDQAPGRADLSTCETEDERRTVLDEVIENMVRMHAIDASKFAAIGMKLPKEPTEIAHNIFDEFVNMYQDAKTRPEPLLEFVIAWVRRNVPKHRNRVCLAWGDPGQFLFHEGRLTAMLDFELAYLGDPIHDLAGLPLRDTAEPLGDLKRAYRRYMELTGEEIEPEVFDFYMTQWAICTPLSMVESTTTPLPMGAMLQYMEWFVHFCRYPLEIMAAGADIDLKPLELPQFTPTRTCAMGEGLIGAIRAIPVEGDFATYARDSTADLATYMHRLAVMGPAFEKQDIAETEALLGAKFDTWLEADAALEKFVQGASADQDAKLISLFYRRTQRQAWLMEPVLSRPEVATPARTFNQIMSGKH